jgi:putative ABC transport system substrate-binding protein
LGYSAATIERERPDALWVTGSGFFASHSAQIVNLAARSRIPAAYGSRDIVVAGGLMSYAAKVEDSIHQVGVYAGRILKGAKPADLPVVQATTFEFVINLQNGQDAWHRYTAGCFCHRRRVDRVAGRD